MGSRLSVLLLFFCLALGAAEPPPPAPHPDPADYPPGTIFSAVMSPDGAVAWAPSQDPERPALVGKDGTPLPILPYNVVELPSTQAKEFGVVRSGGHHTIAQMMFYQSASPEQRRNLREGRSIIERKMLLGYVAVTVTFHKNRAGGWTPEIVSWKSTQLNLNNVLAWQDHVPPWGVKALFFQNLAMTVNHLTVQPAPCLPAFEEVGRIYKGKGY
jgi:hypothetical protein